MAADAAPTPPEHLLTSVTSTASDGRDRLEVLPGGGPAVLPLPDHSESQASDGSLVPGMNPHRHAYLPHPSAAGQHPGHATGPPDLSLGRTSDSSITGLELLSLAQRPLSSMPPRVQAHGAVDYFDDDTDVSGAYQQNGAGAAAAAPSLGAKDYQAQIQWLQQREIELTERNRELKGESNRNHQLMDQNASLLKQIESMTMPQTAGQWGVIYNSRMSNEQFEPLCMELGGRVFPDGLKEEKHILHGGQERTVLEAKLGCLLPPAPAQQRGDVDGGRFDSEAILRPIMDTVGAEFVRVQEELQQHHSDVTAHGDVLREAMESLHSQNQQHSDEMQQAVTRLDQQQHDINRVYVVVVVIIIIALTSLACNVWGEVKEFVFQRWEQRITEKENNQESERMKTPELMESGQLDDEVRVVTHDC